MKKALTLTILALAAVAMMTSFAFAGSSCSADKTAKAETASAKATTASDKACTKTCTAEEMAACAKAMGMSVEECAKACAEGKFVKETISIDGMTCTGCEGTIKTTLTKVEGIQHVLSISYKDKNAVVCYDPHKVKQEAILKAIASKGYEAKFVNAVAKTSDSKMKAAGSACSKTCTPAEKAACEGTKKEKKDDSKGDI